LKIPAKIFVLVFLSFVFSHLYAQTRYQQFTLGGGLGAATAYAGADRPQTNIAFYANACYYPVPVFNVCFEGQGGALSGAADSKSRSHKSFNNNYKAVIVDANLYLGVFFDPEKNKFLNVIKNFYGGVGYGVIANSINNVDLANIKTTNHVNNTLNMVPFKGGYEYSILKNRYNEPVLKADFSATFNYVIGKGLDGYYDNYAGAFSFYAFYAVGLKYTFIIHATYGKSYNKFD
jgi:hypothetical protein